MPIGIPAAMLISAAVAGGTGIAGAALSSRKKTTTTTPTIRPESEGLADLTRRNLAYSQENPEAIYEPQRIAGLDRINRRYRDVPQAITTRLAQRGYGSSGNMSTSMWNAETSRLGELSDFDTAIMEAINNERWRAINGSNAFLASERGQETTIPGDVAGSALQSGGRAMENFLTLMTLEQLLKPNSTGTTTNVNPVTNANWQNWAGNYLKPR